MEAASKIFLGSLLITALPSWSFASAEDLAAREEVRIEPEINYREAFLTKRESSVFYSEKKHRDFVDQLYFTLNLSKTVNDRHEVVIAPSIRTPRHSPAAGQLEVLFEQAYIESQISEGLLLTAGKKSEIDGSGYVINPSDLLNEDKELLDRLYQKEGKVFTRLMKRWRNFSLGLGYIPKRGSDAKDGKFWAQASADIWDIDARLQMTQHAEEKATIGTSVARFFGEHFELHADGRYQSRQRSIAQEKEMAYSSYEAKDASTYYVAGTRIVLASNQSFVIEGIQRQSGLMPQDFERYFADIDAQPEPPDPEKRLLGRHYAFVTYQDQATFDSFLLGLSALLNTDDQSYLTIGQVKYFLSSLTSIELVYTGYHGKAKSEFGEYPFSSVVLAGFAGKF